MIIQSTTTIEPTSYLWHKRFIDNEIPIDGTIVEVAPGYEPKIGNALRLYGFRGTIFLVEPDEQAAKFIQKMYQEILPQATVKIVAKALENIIDGIDVPCEIDALIASHPFDDMVIANIARENKFFSEEKDDGARLSADKKDFYSAIEDEEYKRAVQSVIATWKNSIRRLQPECFIASQYPSHTLSVKGLLKRQESGFAVLRELKSFYQDSLKEQNYESEFGYKGNPDWWIIARLAPLFLPLSKGRLGGVIAYDLSCKPAVMKRLGESVFVPQLARPLHSSEYETVYVDKEYFKSQGYSGVEKYVSEFAITLNNENPDSHKTILAYADRQKDATDISLSGNLGSGRAVYYGARFNIIGVGKTTLCKSIVPSHSTGRMDLVSAMRRLIVSKWISRLDLPTKTEKTQLTENVRSYKLGQCHKKRVSAHPVLIALKQTAKFKWNPDPISLALLVRIDDGSLDRPTHVEFSPKIIFDFGRTLTEYARLDAEYFAYRFMLGAWCAGNYSLNGNMIDLETVSFTKYRGPYHTSSTKYPENRFGYEGLGFIRILKQLARVKNLSDESIERDFYKERSLHMGRCFLSLLGVRNDYAINFFSRHRSEVVALASEFERLAKKVSTSRANLNLYFPVSDHDDPSLLDMSNLFRNLAKLYGSSNAENKALEYLTRKKALFTLSQEYTAVYSCDSQILTKAEAFLKENAVVTESGLKDFFDETKRFIQELFKLLAMLDAEKCLEKKATWHERLQKINQDFPPMFELNTKLCALAEQYRLGEISAAELGGKIEKLMVLRPENNTT